MLELTPVFVLTIVFGAPVAMVWLRYRHKERMAEIAASKTQAALPPAQTVQLEERIVRLEAIVTTVEFELDAKLRRLPEGTDTQGGP